MTEEEAPKISELVARWRAASDNNIFTHWANALGQAEEFPGSRDSRPHPAFAGRVNTERYMKSEQTNNERNNSMVNSPKHIVTILGRPIAGQFNTSDESLEIGYFSIEEALNKVKWKGFREQIEYCINYKDQFLVEYNNRDLKRRTFCGNIEEGSDFIYYEI